MIKTKKIFFYDGLREKLFLAFYKKKEPTLPINYVLQEWYRPNGR